MEKILKSNLTIFLVIISSIYTGLSFPKHAAALKPLADIYVSFIMLMITPIVFLSLMSTMCKIFKGDIEKDFLKSLLKIFVGTIFIVAIVAILSGALYSPGHSMSKNPIISELVYKSVQENIMELSLNDPVSKIGGFDLMGFFIEIFPKDFFKSLADGKHLQIIFLGITLGITLAFFPKKEAKKRDEILESVDSAWFLFQSFLKNILYLLPFGLFALIASSFSNFSGAIFQAISSLYLAILICFFVIGFISLIAIKFSSPKGLKETLLILKEPLQISFSTGSNQFTMPFLMSALTENLKLDKEKVSLIVPLSLVLCRGGSIAYFTFSAIFIADVYNHALSIQEYIFIGLGSILASLMGLTGVAGVSLLSFILGPLSVPVGAILVILIVLDPLIDPFRTVLSTLIHITLNTMALKKKAYQEAIT